MFGLLHRQVTVINCYMVLFVNQVKNAGRKLGRRCDMCSNYEKQLQAIQGQEAETRDQVCVFALLFSKVLKCLGLAPMCSQQYSYLHHCPPGEEAAGYAPTGQ